MRRILATTALCATIGLVAAGCGGSSTGSTGAGAPAAKGTQQQGQAGFMAPAGSGKVVDVSGSTAQVQGQSSQVAVTWTGRTTFTRQVSAALADVTTGSCVMVSSAAAGGSSSTSTVAATSVRITAATDGTCTRDGGGPQGGRGGPGAGAPQGERPSGAPSGRRGLGGVYGEVTAVSGSGFTVSSQQGGSTSVKTTKVSVTTTGRTTFTKTAKASSSDVKTGVCVTSRGDADDTGAVTADSIAISKAVDGACTPAFGARPQS